MAPNGHGGAGPFLRREPAAEGPVVRGFSPQGFRVGNRIVPGGLLLTPTDARDWSASRLDALEAGDTAPLLALEPPPEFVLLGTGTTLRRPPAAFANALEARDIGLEAMDSRAAARAWGVLRAEGRWIAAALLPLDEWGAHGPPA